jgi:hypothetical protein
MNELGTPFHTNCPQCGGTVDPDARFCKHCAFDLLKVIPPSDATVPTAVKDHRHRNPKLMALGGGVAIIGLVLLGIIGTYIYKRNRAQSAGAISSPMSASPMISDRAKQIESKILRGEGLSDNDIGGLSAYELRVLRNLHFARYGRKYDQTGELGSYFYSRPWYKPSDSYNDNMISATDKANINLILGAERALQPQSTPTVTTVVPSSPSPESSETVPTTAKYQLSQEKMRQLIQQRGAWDYFYGWQRVDRVEITRVGDFKADQKYWPVQVKAYIGNRYYVLNYQVFINDYGDWEVRMIGTMGR